jgi:hypothetical protein
LQKHLLKDLAAMEESQLTHIEPIMVDLRMLVFNRLLMTQIKLLHFAQLGHTTKMESSSNALKSLR